MGLKIVLAASVVLQLAAAVVALRLIHVTGRRAAWGLISGALALMAVRRGVSLWQLTTIGAGTEPLTSLGAELIALLISVLMLLGVIGAGAIFRRHALARKQLQESEERFHSMFDATSDSLFVHDMKGQFIDVNAAACRELGYSRAELLGRSVADIEVRQNVGEFDDVWRRLKSEGPVRFEGRHRRKDGGRIPVELTLNPFKYHGRWLVVAVARDITERRRMEAEREKLIADLQAAATNVKQLKGLLPICSVCKKIRDDEGYWKQIDAYVREHADVQFSHSICPHCAKQLFGRYS